MLYPQSGKRKPGEKLLAPIGIAAASLVALLALAASRRTHFYASDVYGMTPRSHRRFAALCVLVALLFGAAARVHSDAAATGLWAAFATASILYGASFLRGYGEP